MAASKERREVAERMRERPVARNINEAYVAIVQAIGVRPCLLSHEGESGDRFNAAAYAEALEKLADLMDPTCHAVHPDTAADDELVCSECGAYMGAIVPFIGAVLPLYCPSCGARVVEGGEG